MTVDFFLFFSEAQLWWIGALILLSLNLEVKMLKSFIFANLHYAFLLFFNIIMSRPDGFNPISECSWL